MYAPETSLIVVGHAFFNTQQAQKNAMQRRRKMERKSISAKPPKSPAKFFAAKAAKMTWQGSRSRQRGKE